MSRDNPLDNRTNAALREAGFVPLPRLWIKGRDMHRIHAITSEYKDEVLNIRRNMRIARGEDPNPPRPQRVDPKVDRDAAWAALEEMRNQ